MSVCQRDHNPSHRNRDLQAIPTAEGPSLREEPTLLLKYHRARLSLYHYPRLYLLLAESGRPSPSFAAATSAGDGCTLYVRGSTYCFEPNAAKPIVGDVGVPPCRSSVALLAPGRTGKATPRTFAVHVGSIAIDFIVKLGINRPGVVIGISRVDECG